MAGSTVVYTLQEIARHKSKKDCWFIINGRVLNVTKFLEEHPGGDDVLLEVAGKDATKEFEHVGHSKAAQLLLSKYQVGILEGQVVQVVQDDVQTAAAVNEQTKSTKDMPAFVIKEKGWLVALPGFLELAVPLVASVSYFGYSYLSRVAAAAS